MDYRKLLVNSLLAGLWAGLAVLAATDQPLSKVALLAAITAAVRGAIGALAEAVNHPVSVDRV